MNLTAVHHAEQYFTNGVEFDPNRWLGLGEEKRRKGILW